MATELLSKVLSLSENLADLLYSKWQLKWNNKTKLFRYEISIKTVNHLLQNSAVCCVFICMFPLALYAYINPTRQFNADKLFVLVILAGVLVPSILLVDIMMTKYGADLATITNWAISTECKILNKKWHKKEKSLAELVWSEINKFSSSTPSHDWFGLLSLQFFLSIQINGIIMPFLLFAINMAPITVAVNIFLGDTIWYNYFYTPAFQIVYLLTTIYLSECSLHTFSNAFIVNLTCVHSILVIFRHLLSSSYSLLTLTKIYKQMFVAKNHVVPMIKIYVSGYLVTAFFGILLATNTAVLGYGKLPSEIYFVVSMSGVLQVGILVVALSLYVIMHEKSMEILHQWTRALTITRRLGYLPRVIQSLQPIAFSIGVGITDRDLKVNYLRALLEYIVNSMIVFSGFVEH